MLSLSIIPNRCYESLKLKIGCVDYARSHKPPLFRYEYSAIFYSVSHDTLSVANQILVFSDVRYAIFSLLPITIIAHVFYHDTIIITIYIPSLSEQYAY